MTRIIVASKEGLDVLQDGQLNKVVLNQPTIIQIGVSQKDIASMEKQGGSLVIHLKNGETIVLENFFNEATNTTEHSLVFPTEQGKFVEAQFDAQGKVIDYRGLNHVTDLAYTSTSPSAATMAVDNDPSFSLGNVLKAGLAVLAAEGLYLWAFDNDDKDDSPVNVPTTAKPTEVKLADDAVTVTGKAEANAKIYIKDLSGNVIASGNADASGNFTIKLDKPLTDGNKLNVSAQNEGGKESSAYSITGPKDTIAPDAPEAQLNEDGSILDGKTEPDAKVMIYDASGKFIDTVTASKEGKFSYKFTPPLTGGKVVAIDLAGNESKPTLIFAGKDTIPPKAPLLEVNKEGTVIEGTAEANTKVYVKDADGNVIGTGTANAQGEFQITLSSALKDSQKATIIVEDAAGNTSKPLEIKSGYDTLAPDKPTAQINADGTTVTGTAEANAKIEIKNSADKIIGTGTADANGKFTITISPALTDNKTADVIAIDGAGNSSGAFEVTGTKDTIPPDRPVFTKLENDNGTTLKQILPNSETDDTTPKFTVKVESHATLTVYDNGVAISMIEIGDLGKSTTWSFTLDKELSLGKHTITLMQKDAAGLTGEVSSPFTFYVVAPKAASLSETSVDTLSTEGPSLADSVGLHTLKAAQSTTTETNNPQKSVPLDDLLKSSTASESDPIAKLLSSTALKTTQASEPIEVNASVGQTTSNADHPLPDTTSSVLQNLLDQTYPVV
ncbi:BapA prefix-like domain-containing protein [Acinetobacter baumannii]|uniref:Ig-like repeat protein Blp2 n=1 Tax=Acinetobacter baumannii TaxID=470 RepID=UPI000DE67615|nr:Ig-like repeat protein Blp2 [Acinetobacter baumannii]EKT9377718.1 BapA prefix-like domain-containing protein [Acinetobacter baumannii]EKU0756597.1 BapA prefix-like domain-containing protein [Acinetobacter baumannii]EKV8391238.1 BapA prefix-like domain-containing protein [Acinetobacter baumannii]EKW0730362.1 BapA prefix-like domain-containing protein [Acinetobacter baumannii]EKW0736134.1 BapA prefix-like domain-containing protein [Acinetobacter baumannii]